MEHISALNRHGGFDAAPPTTKHPSSFVEAEERTAARAPDELTG